MFIHSIVHYSGGTATQAIQTPANNSYHELQPPAGTSISLMSRLTFSVRSCNDAHVLLSTDATSWRSGTNMYQIVIGGWYNTKSVIRKDTNGANLVTTHHSKGPMSCGDFRRFYVSWKDGVIEVGAVVADPSQPGTTTDEPFMTYTGPSGFLVNHLFVGGWNQPATWLIGECVILALVAVRLGRG